jgi:hypothetical protein
VRPGEQLAANPGSHPSTKKCEDAPARRALYIDTCFARGTEGGPGSCDANCLDLRERCSYLALGAKSSFAGSGGPSECTTV